MSAKEQEILMRNEDVQRQMTDLKDHIDNSYSSLNSQLSEFSKAMTQLAISQTRSTAQYEATEKEINRLASIYTANHNEMKNMLSVHKAEARDTLASHDFRLVEVEKDVINLRGTLQQGLTAVRGEMRNESTEIRGLVTAVHDLANSSKTTQVSWGNRAGAIIDKVIVWGLLAFLAASLTF